MKKYNHAKIQAAVISLDGNSDDLLNRVRSLSIDDYQKIISEVDLLLPTEGKESQTQHI